ncbi:hypothetical protein V8D89_003153 [Ganoderma adspersum]
MYGELKTTVDEPPPIPVPPPDGPHLLPPTPPSRDFLSLPLPDPTMPSSALQSPGLSFAPGFLTPQSFVSFTPPVVHTPGAHDIELFHEAREAASSPTPLHEILRDPSVLTSILSSHRKKPRRGSSSSQVPRMSDLAAELERDRDRERVRERSRDALKPEPSGSSSTSNSTTASSKGRASSRERSRGPDRDHGRERERVRDRERERDRDTASCRTTDTASTVKPRRKERDRDRGRDSDSTSILTHVLAEEERQARHLKAVLRQTATRLEEELRRADSAESRARTAELGLADVSARLAAVDAARHQLELDTTRAQEECRRWQMQADAAERETRRVQAELGRAERARLESDQGEREAKEAARRAEQMLREWKAREEGREEMRRLEVRRRYSDGRDEGFEDGRAEGYEAGRHDGYEDGRDEGFSTGRIAGFEEGKKAGYKDGFQTGYTQGRKEERAKALEAFDQFIETEMDHHPRGGESDTEHEEEDRTRRWVEATRRSLRERDLSPLPPLSGSTTPRAAPQLQPQVHLQAPEPQQHLIKSPPPPPPRPMPATEATPPPPYIPQVYGPPPLPPAPVPPPMLEKLQPQPRPQLQPQPVQLQAPQPMRPQAQREPSPAPKLVWLRRPLNHNREPSADTSRSPLQIIPLAEQRA